MFFLCPNLSDFHLDLEQFLRSIHRYVQIGVHIKGYYSTKYQRFHREVTEVTEFYVTNDTNEAKYNVLYRKTPDGHVTIHNPTQYLIDYLESQGVIMPKDILVKEEFHEPTDSNANTTSSQVGFVNAKPVQQVQQNVTNSVSNAIQQNGVVNNLASVNLRPNIQMTTSNVVQ